MDSAPADGLDFGFLRSGHSGALPYRHRGLLRETPAALPGRFPDWNKPQFPSIAVMHGLAVAGDRRRRLKMLFFGSQARSALTDEFSVHYFSCNVVS